MTRERISSQRTWFEHQMAKPSVYRRCQSLRTGPKAGRQRRVLVASRQAGTGPTILRRSIVAAIVRLLTPRTHGLVFPSAIAPQDLLF